MPITALSLAVVGVQFPNKSGPTRRFAIDLCRPGDPIQLVPEPKNPADPHAVMVLNGQGMQMGYLTAERAPWIGGMLGQGREVRAIFQERTEWGGWIRAAFDGEDPVLPAQSAVACERANANQDDEWWPDEVWPDE